MCAGLSRQLSNCNIFNIFAVGEVLYTVEWALLHWHDIAGQKICSQLCLISITAIAAAAALCGDDTQLSPKEIREGEVPGEQEFLLALTNQTHSGSHSSSIIQPDSMKTNR